MAKPVTKAKEITDARISFVSLVDKAANRRPFLIVKNEDGKATFTTYGKIIKADSDSHFVTGVVYEPLVEDAHGNYMTADEIAKAAYWFAKNGNKVDLQHNFVSAEGTAVVESWIAKSDCDIGGETVKEGTWLMTVEIKDDDLWNSIEKGEITGLSMGGLGFFAQEDTDLSSASVTKAQGRVEKGAVTDNFKQSNTSSSFWNAFDALRSALYTYNGYTGTYTYQTDEDTIKAALEEFGTIITNLLSDASSEKPLTKSLFECKPTPELGHIEKAGRSLSAKNREALQGLYDSLGTFLASVDADPDKDKPGGETGTEEDTTDDPDNKKSGDDTSTETDKNKEGKTMTKSEAEKLVQDAVAKALGQQQSEQAPATVEKAAGEEITHDFVQNAVDAAIKKALGQQEPEQKQEQQLTKADLSELIDGIVAKSVSAVLSSRANPTNLNGASGTVQKSAAQEDCYLHGIL